MNTALLVNMTSASLEAYGQGIIRDIVKQWNLGAWEPGIDLDGRALAELTVIIDGVPVRLSIAAYDLRKGRARLQAAVVLPRYQDAIVGESPTATFALDRDPQAIYKALLRKVVEPGKAALAQAEAMIRWREAQDAELEATLDLLCQVPGVERNVYQKSTLWAKGPVSFKYVSKDSVALELRSLSPALAKEILELIYAKTCCNGL